ncbi:MAG: imelysin family protein [Ignavibacteria bacterium]|nr:imelysin family protein [Ignavibacteria bacterium]
MKTRSSFLLSAIAVLVVAMTIIACKPDSTQPTDSYNRKAMLTTVADSVIIPSYTGLEATSALLQAAVLRFSLSPNEKNLLDAQSAWKATFVAWQNVSIFDFGPAESLFGHASADLATFPASPLKIESFIVAADTSLDNYDRDARGILGLEYLLFHTSAPIIVQEYLAQPSRSAYVRAVAARVYSECSRLLNTWKESYGANFIANNGTDAGSSTSLLFNNLNISFEALKNYKLALPMGRRAGQSAAEPTKVEAFYSTNSIIGIKNHFATIELVWERGFADYLLHVVSGERVSTETREQFQRVDSVLATIGNEENLSSLISQNDSRLEALFMEMQKLTRFLKSEASSVLGISITYSSGDGD